MKPIRVTHVTFGLDGGGLESLVAAMAHQFYGTEIVMSAITLSSEPGRTGRAIEPVLESIRAVRPVRILSMIFPAELSRAIRETRPDVVHLHSGCWNIGSRAAKLAQVRRIIFTEHGREFNDSPLRQWIDRRASRQTDAVIAVSTHLAHYLERSVGIDPRKVRCIPNGVDVNQFMPATNPTNLRAALGLPSEAYIVGSIGRLEPVKAFERLLVAVAQLNKKDLERPVACVIWGEGSERSRLTSLASELGIADLVRLPGWTESSVESHQALDIFALTSTSEGASVSLMESLACGIPPVVTDVGANARLVGPELASQVVVSGDANSLRLVIERTLRDPQMARELGAKGRAWIESHYSLSAMLQQYRALYHEL